MSSNKMGPGHTEIYGHQLWSQVKTLGRRPTGMSYCQLHGNDTKKRRGLSGAGRGCQVSNGIVHMWMSIYFGSNSFQYLKSKGNFQKLSSLYTWTFVEEIMLNLQIPCGVYSALIPGVGIRAPCAERGEERPLQCRSLSVKETQNQAPKL